MTLLQKLGLGKQKEEVKRLSFEEIVSSSINPESVRANELAQTVEKHLQKNYQRWDYPDGGKSLGHHFIDDSALALAYIGIGRIFDANMVLRGMEQRYSSNLFEPGHTLDPRCYGVAMAAYAALGYTNKVVSIFNRVKDHTESNYFWGRREKLFLQFPEFSLAHVALGDYETAYSLLEKVFTRNEDFKPHYFGLRSAMLIASRNPCIFNIQYYAPRNVEAAVSLLCLGENATARKILKGIDEHLGFDEKTWLVLDRGFNNGKWSPGSENISATALLSFAYSLADKTEKPKEIKPRPYGHPYRSLPQNVWVE